MEDFDVSILSTGNFICIYLISGVIYFYFFKAILLFKNSLKDLSTRKYFSELVTHNFKRMGPVFLICGVSFLGLKKISPSYFE